MDPYNLGVFPVPPPGGQPKPVVADPGSLPPEVIMALMKDPSVDDEVQNSIRAMRGEQSDLAAMQALGTPRMAKYAQAMQGPAMQGFQMEAKGVEDRALKRALKAADLMGKYNKNAANNYAPSKRYRFDTDQGGNRLVVDMDLAGRLTAQGMPADEAFRQATTTLGYKAPQKISQGDTNAITESVQVANVLDTLERDFKDEYANSALPSAIAKGYVSAQQGLGSYAGMIGGSEDEARWWSQFQQLVEIPRRHQMFGSALTAQEKKSWDEASTVKPGISAGQLRMNIAILRDLYQTAIDRLANKNLAQGANPEAVTGLTGGRHRAPGPAPTPRGPPVTTPPPGGAKPRRRVWNEDGTFKE